ncbi:MAG: TrkH family potassium uptake protein [Eubacteriales bacterium]|jgi:trk system potassium uptake protein TrkH
MDRNNTYKPAPLSPMRLILAGYSLIIVIGTVLLMTPYSTRSGVSPTILEALFTATSATCVTGLIVHDTWRFWSTFGQIVILLLIEIGGLGFLTFAVLAATFTRKRIGLRERMTMQESINAPQLGGIVRMTRFIIFGSFSVQGIAALLYATRFVPRFGWGRGIWYSVFHAISFFCNAGFDLMGEYAPCSSLMSWQNDFVVNVVTMGLIELGGLGYFVWVDLRDNRAHFKRYKLHTKLVLFTTAVLIVLPALMILIFEYHGKAFAGFNFWGKLQAAFFQSITTRTAGVNTVKLAAMTDQSVLLMTVLMLIGGSPGSTAGGMKTTTAALFILIVFSVMRRRRAVEVFGRRVPDQTVRNAVCVVASVIVVFLLSTMLLCAFDGLPMRKAMFEVASACSTVGLTLGITGSLSTASKLLIILLMFFGRVGSLTILYAFSEAYEPPASKFPEAPVIIG